jgi:hypothetical protein
MLIESEKKLEILLKNTIEKNLKGKCFKLLSNHVTGLPDRICLLPGGKVFFAEIKTTKQKPKRIQMVVHRMLRDLGFIVEIIETSEQIRNIARNHENERR